MPLLHPLSSYWKKDAHLLELAPPPRLSVEKDGAEKVLSKRAHKTVLPRLFCYPLLCGPSFAPVVCLAWLAVLCCQRDGVTEH